jgi:protein involved in polysaccharide export with SLBB domain
VTGFARMPGAYNVSSLSTLLGSLIQAGGPSASGSFRNIELRRNGQRVADFDFYQLLLHGDRSADKPLLADDVIYIGPSGPQVALVGSVNKPAIFELRPGETLNDVLDMAGGFNTVADSTRLLVQHIGVKMADRVAELPMPQSGTQKPQNGDLLRAISVVDAAHPRDDQSKRVKVEGEVLRPGEYVLPANATLNDAIAVAGGLTKNAFVFGTEFTRDSVRKVQQENYDRALRDLETEFTRTTSTQRAISADDAAAQAARASGATRLIERLRATRPTGRVVLQLDYSASRLPELAVEDGDRINVPPVPNTVGIFGSVFNGGSFIYRSGSTLEDILRLAGGPTRGADPDSIFVLRANGTVVSARQSSNWFGGGDITHLAAQPGDTVFVPEELNKTSFLQGAKEWTQILYQFGLGVAAFKVIVP